ncbi:MAG: hypothetical protein HN617_08330 [Planctomycetaceae bacterium]|jgi:hypothetical protein|nr:hypothetical protein [Planctomycetaceae bacterium]MBT4724175.1 hypothetical protein [Planctomycetaceae bacterium]MBT6847315.1 hypothetical protein [Planctomycetaceae bacterium]MBT7917538.1 hypothetical protein [Planctomycetaceae bacterium]
MIRLTQCGWLANRITTVMAIGFFAIGLVSTALQAAAPTVTHLYPWGLQQGTTEEISVKGSWTKWPLEVAGEFPAGLKIKSLETAGQLSVETSTEVRAGVYHFRLFDGEGATKVIPLIVGAVPEFREKEPNGKPGEGNKIALPAVINGQLKESADVDIFLVDLAEGETLSLLFVANNILGVAMDAIIQVCDSRGFVLAQNDDERGLDPQLSYTAKRTSMVQVRIFAFPEATNSSIAFSSNADYIYRLTATTKRLLDFCLPLSVSAESMDLQLQGAGFTNESLQWTGTVEMPYVSFAGVPGTVYVPLTVGKVVVATRQSSIESPQVVVLPASISGVIEQREDQDVFLLESLQKGESLVVSLFARSLGFPTDPLIEIYDNTGKLLSTQDDKDRATRDPAFTYKIPADGAYQIRIRDLHRVGGPRYAYRMEVAKLQPDVKLTLGSGEFVKSGEKLEIEVAISRLGGFADELMIDIDGLPEGVGIEAVKSEGSGDSSKKVKLVLIGKWPLFSVPIRIIGTWNEGQSQVLAEYAVAKSIIARTDPWLTSVPAK